MYRPRLISVEFVTSVASSSDLPGDTVPEIAMAGRSNVGKSTLINALTGRKLARTSAAPGKTRLANVFRLRPDRMRPFYLVDLPGYGYARGAPGGRAFESLTQEYFFGTDGRGGPMRPAIAGIVLLVDGRHPGLEPDCEAAAWFAAWGCPLAIAATKVDKLTRAERQRNRHAFRTAFGAPPLMLSALTGEGLEDLWTWITQQLELWTPTRRPSTSGSSI
ncbi:MAG: ribosome biogenesis GTP-binding protein YihA/YsxC [Acidobacteriota bacterium]